MENLVLQTTKVSVLAQIATGIVGVYGLLQDVAPEKKALQFSLAIEMFVQGIELLFYFWFLANFNLAMMAQTRYKDWFLNTPLMLISSMVFLKYEKERENGNDTKQIVRDFFKHYGKTIAIVVFSNVMMIAFGYAGERGWLTMPLSCVLGFGAFAVTFGTVWFDLASKSALGRRLWAIMASVWALYGVAFLLPVASKNISYNVLDVVAKNFFGVFLAYKVGL